MAWNWNSLLISHYFQSYKHTKWLTPWMCQAWILQLIITLLIDQNIFTQIKTMCGSPFVIYLECLFSNSYQKRICFSSKLFFNRSIFLMICRNYKVRIIFIYRHFVRKLQREMSYKRKMFDHNFMHWWFCIVFFYLNTKNQLTYMRRLKDLMLKKSNNKQNSWLAFDFKCLFDDRWLNLTNSN